MLSSFTACVLVLFVAVYCCGQAESDEVTCKDLHEVCECNTTECNFRLNITELQTFASYNLENGIELTEGAQGNPYFVDGSGYHPSPRRTNFTGPCYMETPPPVYDSDFSSRNCSVPMTVDGGSYRLFIAVNGRIPGPTLIVNEGAVVRVSVHNRLTSEGITIHWHGMHQKDTPWMDGVGFISQAPITPGATFDYVFKATPAGTHWYHSHVGAQRTDGLFGALIVRDRKFEMDIVPALLKLLPDLGAESITDMPGRHTMTLLDWQREASLNLFVRIHPAIGFYVNKSVDAIPSNSDNVYSPTLGSDSIEVGPIPYWSGLINGKGRYNISDPSPLSVFPVAANKAYRFRVIGAQSVYAYSLSVDAHKLTVIATDGHFIEPITVDFLIVHSGERYDFILKSMDMSEGSYWIRAETLETDPPNNREHSARAILKYGSEDDTDVDWRSLNIPNSRISCTADQQCKVLNCPFLNYPKSDYKNCIHLTNLSSLTQLPVQSKPCNDCTLFLNFGFEGINLTSAINGRNFKLPVTPYQTTCERYNEDKGDCSDCSESNPQRCRCIHVEEIMQAKTFDKDHPETQIMVFSVVGEENQRQFNCSSHSPSRAQLPHYPCWLW